MMENNINVLYMDALLFSMIKDGVTDKYKVGEMIAGLGEMPTTLEEINKYNNELLTETVVKRACCMRLQQNPDAESQTITVKIPIPNEYKDSTSLGAGNKFKYFEKQITVPASMCDPSMTQAYCDRFYQIYCHNIRDTYEKEKEELGEKYDGQEWANFAKDCACYGKEVKDLILGYAIPHNCYMIGCGANQTAYLDKSSRKSGGGVSDCNLTICQSTIDMSGLEGRDISFVPSILQQCGGTSTKESTTVAEEELMKTTETIEKPFTESKPITSSTPISSTTPPKNNNDDSDSNSKIGIILIIVAIIVIILILLFYF